MHRIHDSRHVFKTYISEISKGSFVLLSKRGYLQSLLVDLRTTQHNAAHLCQEHTSLPQTPQWPLNRLPHTQPPWQHKSKLKPTQQTHLQQQQQQQPLHSQHPSSPPPASSSDLSTPKMPLLWPTTPTTSQYQNTCLLASPRPTRSTAPQPGST